jgi:NAD(P)-dependent dehydrogenase (short-subunit alcohol dehydrogenase family)
MEVNFYGHVAMTKKMLPLLIVKRDSRIVNVVSAAGFFSFPNTSAYSAAKYALKSFSDCLRREMAPWKLRVSIIEPGALRTTMMDGYDEKLRKIWHGLESDVQQRWGLEYLNKIITTAINSPFIVNADDPMRVVGAIQHAITNTEPRLRYRPGWQGKLIYFVFYLSPAWFSDKLLSIALNVVPSGVHHQL